MDYYYYPFVSDPYAVYTPNVWQSQGADELYLYSMPAIERQPQPVLRQRTCTDLHCTFLKNLPDIQTTEIPAVTQTFYILATVEHGHLTYSPFYSYRATLLHSW